MFMHLLTYYNFFYSTGSTNETKVLSSAGMEVRVY